MPFGLIGSVFSSIVGARNTDKTNDQNLRINRMNNEFNAREAEKAFRRESEYNDRIRAEDREYNSASAQVQRYRDAGLNPAMMMQGQSAGVAQSNGVGSSAASAAPSAPAQSFTPNFDTSGLGQGVLGFLKLRQDQQMNDEILKGLMIDNQFKARQNMVSLMDKIADIKNKDVRYRLDKQLEAIQPQLLQQDLNVGKQQENQLRTQAELNTAERLLKSKELSIFDERHRANMAYIGAQTALAVANQGLLFEQASTEVAKRLYMAAQEAGQKISNDQARKLAPYVLKEAIENARNSEGPQSYVQAAYQGMKATYELGAKHRQNVKDAWNKFIYKPWIRPLQRGLGL